MPLLKAGALSAVLTYLDFFPMGVQRTAVATASNMCRNVPASCVEAVSCMYGTLTSLLSSPDQKLVECASECVLRLAEGMASDVVNVERLASHGLVKAAMERLLELYSGIGGSGSSATNGTLTATAAVRLLRLLGTLAQSSQLLCSDLINAGVTTVLMQGFGGMAAVRPPMPVAPSTQSHSAMDVDATVRLDAGNAAPSVGTSAPSAPSDSSTPTKDDLDTLLALISLANQLLPPLQPNTEVCSSPTHCAQSASYEAVWQVLARRPKPAEAGKGKSSRAPVARSRRRKASDLDDADATVPTSAGASSSVVPTEAASSGESMQTDPAMHGRLELWATRAELLETLASALIPALMHAVGSAAQPMLRLGCVCVYTKLCNLLPPTSLVQVCDVRPSIVPASIELPH